MSILSLVTLPDLLCFFPPLHNFVLVLFSESPWFEFSFNFPPLPPKLFLILLGEMKERGLRIADWMDAEGDFGACGSPGVINLLYLRVWRGFVVEAFPLSNKARLARTLSVDPGVNMDAIIILVVYPIVVSYLPLLAEPECTEEDQVMTKWW